MAARGPSFGGVIGGGRSVLRAGVGAGLGGGGFGTTCRNLQMGSGDEAHTKVLPMMLFLFLLYMIAFVVIVFDHCLLLL